MRTVTRTTRRSAKVDLGGLIVSIWLGALFVMLALGALHAEVSHSIPALSYGATLLGLSALRSVVGQIAESVGSNYRFGRKGK